ncbi:kelch repeat-containing protein [Roseivirga sp. 4D4]|uniref:Kelch repeat-containing protein n=1 Tax=Roseivirga sp. 4D4 TaxID=1889784 RepID=UPI00147D2056|nr:kelch repeat-containing protein [Roseivirga sp. 4D4]
MAHLILIPFILLMGCVNSTNKEKSSVEQSSELSVRNAHSMAYHAKDSLTYLFGGADQEQVLSDLWVMEDTDWRKIETNDGPQPRTFAPLIYDSENDRLILFGGSKVLFGKTTDPQNLLNDTWQFKNKQWGKLITNNAPSPRAEAVMVYDESRNTVVLFGGYNIQDGKYIKLNDTWEFHDNDWHMISTAGPSERHGISMAYGPEDKSVILFGGSTIDKQYGESGGETWQWNGEAWVKLEISQPPGVFNAPMVYDEAEGKFIRFGGWNGKSRIDETWSFLNNEWNKIEMSISPSPRNHSAMVYDEKQKRTVLFGGHDGENVFGDTWIYADRKWKRISESRPIMRVKNGH